jgi:hypothetical protein
VQLQIVTAADGNIIRTLKWPGDTDAVFSSPDAQALDFIADHDGLPNIYRLTIATGKEQSSPSGKHSSFVAFRHIE